jgi:hypothetical protein
MGKLAIDIASTASAWGTPASGSKIANAIVSRDVSA